MLINGELLYTDPETPSTVNVFNPVRIMTRVPLDLVSREREIGVEWLVYPP